MPASLLLPPKKIQPQVLAILQEMYVDHPRRWKQKAEEKKVTVEVMASVAIAEILAGNVVDILRNGDGAA